MRSNREGVCIQFRLGCNKLPLYQILVPLTQNPQFLHQSAGLFTDVHYFNDRQFWRRKK